MSETGGARKEIPVRLVHSTQEMLAAARGVRNGLNGGYGQVRVASGTLGSFEVFRAQSAGPVRRCWRVLGRSTAWGCAGWGEGKEATFMRPSVFVAAEKQKVVLALGRVKTKLKLKLCPQHEGLGPVFFDSMCDSGLLFCDCPFGAFWKPIAAGHQPSSGGALAAHRWLENFWMAHVKREERRRLLHEPKPKS